MRSEPAIIMLLCAHRPRQQDANPVEVSALRGRLGKPCEPVWAETALGRNLRHCRRLAGVSPFRQERARIWGSWEVRYTFRTVLYTYRSIYSRRRP